MESNNFLGVKKITVQTIGLDKATIQKIVEKAKGKPTAICRIVGQTNKLKACSNNMGSFAVFSGLFVGDNYATGEQYRASDLILPSICENELSNLLYLAQKNSKAGDASAVVFGYEIIVTGEAKAAVGYVFSMKSLIKGEDPLNDILSKLPAIPKVKLLA